MSEYESKKYREERASVVKEMHDMSRQLKEEKRDEFTAEEQQKFDRLDKAQEELQRKAETSERVEKVEGLDTQLPQPQTQTFRSNPVITTDDHINAMRAWCLRASGNDHLCRESYTAAANKVGINLNSSAMVVSFDDARAQSTDGTLGGHTIHSSLYQGLDKALLQFGGMRTAAQVVKTEDGGARHWATLNDTTNSASIVGENTDSTNVGFTFSSVSVPVYKYVSTTFPISVELVEDSQINILDLIADEVGTRLARATNAHYTTGDGTGEPNGCVTASAAGETADGTADFSYNNLVDLMHSVDPLYRNSPKCHWMFNDNTLSVLKKELDGGSSGRPLWNSSLAGIADGSPDTILGKPYVVNNSLVSLGASSRKFMLFGDFSRYIVRDVGSVTIQILRELYAQKAAIGVIGYLRTGGNLLNANAVKHMTT